VVVQGGDLALGGPHPVEVVDRIRELGWPGVLGNTDAVLAGGPPIPEQARGFVAQAAARSQDMLGPERVAWLTGQPMEWRGEGIALASAISEFGQIFSVALDKTRGELGKPFVWHAGGIVMSQLPPRRSLVAQPEPQRPSTSG
jgi:hypothetical protein